ncbi:MAG: nitroreductase family protein [Clostridiales bacterium]|nr:nitroreductase family protein [Clostridiales bacterium]
MNRRSVRQYTGEPIPTAMKKQILQAGLFSASSRNRRPWELVVTEDRKVLEALSRCRVGSAKMLEKAGMAVVVLADPEKSDVWTEDCSIVMANMHLMADSLGLGSCWIQGRLRETPEGISTDAYVKELLGAPEGYCLEAILSVGVAESHPAAHTEQDLMMSKVHWEHF